MFIDYAKITVRAGNGGNGCLSFRREKFVPKGGPDGGDGGDGGNVVCKASRHLQTLLDFRYRREYKAKNGRHGQGANKFGKRGEDLVIELPMGTVIKDDITGELIGDLVDDQQTIVVARGGKGGRGNARFATSTNQAPREFEVGSKGEFRTIQLELKLLADVGLVGLPNAGKSTMLSVISAARPKIADYPFTTLQPNLGIVKYRDHTSFVVADIPGLIEGAHQGKGLGIQFIRHIERTRIIAYLIDSQSDDIMGDHKILREELGKYNENLLKKASCVFLTKIDTISSEELGKMTSKIPGSIKWVAISSVTGEGIDAAVSVLWELLEESGD
ncbi:MAG: GTPase ObgE [candidate division KSB1 bacterium]|jgi:GTP-binding protein|nr:GTPase ObgE [candidate division KSB1 bacterium]